MINRHVSSAILACAISGAISYWLAVAEGPNSAGFTLSWLVGFAAVGFASLLLLGLAMRNVLSARNVGAAYAAISLTVLDGYYLLAWKGNWDFLLIAVVASAAPLGAAVAGAWLTRRR